MLSRILSKPSIPFRFIKTLISSQSISQSQFQSIQNPSFYSISSSRCFSANRGNNNNNGPKPFDSWNISSQNEENTIESLFGVEDTPRDEPFNNEDDMIKSKGIKTDGGFKDWNFVGKSENDNVDGIFDIGNAKNADSVAAGGVSEMIGRKGIQADGGFKDWNFVGKGESENVDGIFDIGNVKNADSVTAGGVSEMIGGINVDDKVETEKKQEENRLLDIEEKGLLQVLKGGEDHAFGDLIAASGITDEMLDSLMALKDLDDVPGLPPLSTIEDMRYEKNTRKSTRADIERQKQEEIANSRVRQVDSQGRAYGTGKRKCSIARVWVEPGEGKFIVNDKQFDVYFPMLDQRAALLRPLSETKMLGRLDVNCTVKGGGISGQVGAIRLGMSRALQNWAPDEFRPPLKEAGFLTRDSRIVERKKPGKAKARKSFQWVKR
ncbi:small ribosomal subunit protein uS9m-like [Rutidosis leptorrhynchoides]|uniref:small ribosomal subunit protein uS9m-like n=1 Tax=Rutidosis leptorrhynchoides TaxID=125765 RepID=UPI003A99C55B